MGFAGHWHCYGLWIGTGEHYGMEYMRKPEPYDPKLIKPPKGRSLPQEAYLPFAQRTIPPTMTGHYLLRKPPDLKDRTFHEPAAALAWLVDAYNGHPPMTRPGTKTAYSTLERRSECALDVLQHGGSSVWTYYLGDGRLCSYAAVACPSLPFHPDIGCPLS